MTQMICGLALIACWTLFLGRHLIAYYFREKEHYFRKTIGEHTDGLER